MPTILGPWDVGFPVRFRANGDTVHDAFYKHIQEIERIYGLLNALDSNKLDAADLAAHVSSSNPHPNLDISNTVGNLQANRVVGNLSNATISIDNVTGNIPASRVYGNLTNATIDSSKVNGLSSLLSNAVNSAISGSNPIVSENKSGNGYIKFKGGFTIQWGETGVYSHSDEALKTMTFPTAFSSRCYSVLVTIHAHSITNAGHMDKTICISSSSVSNTGFQVSIQETTGDTGGAQYSAQYIAIGY